LKEQITGITQAAAGAGAPGAQASPLAQAEKNAMVWADPTNNALVITAPPKIMHAVMDIIDKLDIRRPQVLVEAIIAEVDVDKNTNVLSTPSAVTMDNQEAELKVAQEVPFITGQFTNTAATTGGVTGGINPFQTIQRQEVGTILKVTPTISAEGTSLMLKISI